MTKEEAKIETVEDVAVDEEDNDSSSESDVEETQGAGADAGKQSRFEKKCRKAVQKLNMKPVSGIDHVRIKKDKNIVFVIEKPDVYKNPSSETYVVFGVVNIEDQQTKLAQAAEQFRLVQSRAAAAASGSEAKLEAEEPSAPAPADEEDDDVELSAEGLDEEEVKLVMSQANVSRNKAIKALKQENDLVSAILSLTPT